MFLPGHKVYVTDSVKLLIKFVVNIFQVTS